MSCRSLGAKKITLDFNGSNMPARRMYEKMGFEVEGTLKNHIFVCGKYEDIVIMSLQLN